MEGTNPFEALSDYPIIEIFSYLYRDDLLNLMLVDKRFLKITFDSTTELISRIPLRLDLENPIKIDFLTDLISKRQFKRLILAYVDKTIAKEFTPILQHLSRTVEHIKLDGCRFEEAELRSLLQLFLPKLKTCHIECSELVPIESTTSYIGDEALEYPLEHLHLHWVDTKDDVAKFFAGCIELKSFVHDAENLDETSSYNDFLSRQTKLKKLEFDFEGLDFSRLNFSQLVKLKMYWWGENGAAEFVAKLPELKRLEIEFFSNLGDAYDMFEAICRAPKIEVLKIDFSCYTRDPAFEIPMRRPVNYSVKKLSIICSADYLDLGWILQMFHGVESVELQRLGNLLDPVDLPCDIFEKIELLSNVEKKHVAFSPTAIPVNVEHFEAAVLKFAQKFSTGINSIKIGHNSWLNDGAFRLSHKFCTELVHCLPHLAKLELYNVADRGKLLSFLDSNCRTFAELQEVELHKAEGDEPELKKIKIKMN